MSPPDILFRTHHYEFQLRPNEKLEEWAGRKARFCIDLRLYKRESHTQTSTKIAGASTPTTVIDTNGAASPVTPSSAFSPFPNSPARSKADAVSPLPKAQTAGSQEKSTSSNNNSQNTDDAGSPVSTPTSQIRSFSPFSTPDRYSIVDEEQFRFREFTDNEEPVVTYSATISSHQWNLNLIWPTEKRSLSWRGKFCFHISIYCNRQGQNTYSHVLTKVSSQFAIFSKPDVFLKKIRKDNIATPSPIKKNESDDEDECNSSQKSAKEDGKSNKKAQLPNIPPLIAPSPPTSPAPMMPLMAAAKYASLTSSFMPNIIKKPVVPSPVKQSPKIPVATRATAPLEGSQEPTFTISNTSAALTVSSASNFKAPKSSSAFASSPPLSQEVKSSQSPSSQEAHEAKQEKALTNKMSIGNLAASSPIDKSPKDDDAFIKFVEWSNERKRSFSEMQNSTSTAQNDVKIEKDEAIAQDTKRQKI